MANITINSNAYNDVRYIRVPLASDSTMEAVYEYVGDAAQGQLLAMKQGAITLNGATLTAYDYNKFRSNNTVGEVFYNISDYEENKNFSSGYNASIINVTGVSAILSFKSGDTVRLVVTSNTANDINETGNKIGVNFIKTGMTGQVVNLFLEGDVTRDSEAHTITAEKTLAENFDAHALSMYTFAGTTVDPDITIEFYLNNERIW